MSIRRSLIGSLRVAVWPRPAGIGARIRAVAARWKFLRDYQRYCQLAPDDAKPRPENFLPCLFDATSETPVDPTYYYQDAWVFERIAQDKPEWHVDVGSHHKMVSLLSKIVPTTMVDLRPLPVTLASLRFVEGSVLALPFPDASVPSVSSICVIEHIGLGRYGDPIDPEGMLKALRELQRIVKPGGNLYLSTPLDDINRIYFNAHRAFTKEYLLEVFAPFEVLERRYIFGTEFGETRRAGFGTGCYHLRAPQAP